MAYTMKGVQIELIWNRFLLKHGPISKKKSYPPHMNFTILWTQDQKPKLKVDLNLHVKYKKKYNIFILL